MNKETRKMIIIGGIDLMDATEKCWITGDYSDECICEFCDHKYECSGYEDDEDDDE